MAAKIGSERVTHAKNFHSTLNLSRGGISRFIGKAVSHKNAVVWNYFPLAGWHKSLDIKRFKVFPQSCHSFLSRDLEHCDFSYLLRKIVSRLFSRGFSSTTTNLFTAKMIFFPRKTLYEFYGTQKRGEKYYFPIRWHFYCSFIWIVHF